MQYNATDGEYIIDYNRNLGSGSHADVYFGIGIKDGSQYAIKCIHNSTNYDYTKEVDILRILNHENIVKFYSISYKLNLNRVALIIEYCNKGSLKTFSEMHNGLCDNMFILLLQCLRDGLHYLRQNNVIHRDIKPENVMVHEDNLGDIHMKLCDLGEEKKVENNQTFQSIVGTKPYLKPKMFLQCIGQTPRTEYNINMDIWSVAVTLFQSVTNRIPYLPLEDDQFDPALVSRAYMYTYRRSGSISCVQRNDDITGYEWSTTLPEDCRLSPMLRGLASTLIRNLMDASDTYTYDDFFAEADLIIGRKRVLQFSSWSGELQMLYLDKLNYHRILEHITEYTGFASNELFLLTKQGLVNHGTRLTEDPHSRSKSHFRAQLTDRTILAIRDSKAIESLLYHPFQYLRDPGIPDKRYPSLEEVKTYSDAVLKPLYQINCALNYVDCQDECYIATVKSFNDHIYGKLKLVNVRLVANITAIRGRCSFLSDMLVSVTNSLEASGHHDYYKDDLEHVSKTIEEYLGRIKEGEQCLDQYVYKIVKRMELYVYAKKEFSVYSDYGSIDSLVLRTEESVDEVRLVYDNKIMKDNDKYNGTILLRHTIQYNNYQAAKSILRQRNSFVQGRRKQFSRIISQQLDVIHRIDKLVKFFDRENKKEKIFEKYLVDIQQYFHTLSSSLNRSKNVATIREAPLITIEEFKNRVLEIRNIIEKMKNCDHNKFSVESTK